MRLRPLLLGLLTVAALNWAVARAEVPVPRLTGELVDEAALFEPGARERLRAEVAQLNHDKNIQLAVVTVPSLSGYAVEEFALAVAEKWKLGKKGEDRGVILLIAPQDRRMRFEVGYGLEGELSDVVTKRILSDTIAPYFRKGAYEHGVHEALGWMRTVLDGKPLPRKKGTWDPLSLFVIVFVVILFFLIFIPFGGGPRMRRRGHWDDFGGPYGGGSWGGGGFGGGGGGGGFGGFSGGGGGFGGGGSSSSW